MMEFDLPKDQSSIIKVIGVGGGGSNAVSHMYQQGIKGVDFLICNTDAQALEQSPVPNKIQLGTALTEGRGAGSIAEVGADAAIESIEEVKEILSKETKMVFIAAGMGGGTGTGAAPIIAQAAREMGILTVGIVTYPFSFEGKKRRLQADKGLEELRNNVDTFLVINNDKLREIYGNLSLANAFAKADDILSVAAKGIAEIITVTGYINVDFEDVKTVMKDSGAAIMGSAQASGETRAIEAVETALASPLLNDNHIQGANYILLYITSGEDEVLMDEITEITDYIQDEAGLTADIIWGTGSDSSLGDSISVTLVATGFEEKQNSETDIATGQVRARRKVVHSLDDSVPERPEAKREETKTEEDITLKSDTNVESDSDTKVTRYNLTDEISEEKNSEERTMHNISHTVSPTSTPTNREDHVIRHTLDEDTNETPEARQETENDSTSRMSSPISHEEQLRKSQERIARLKKITSKLNSPSAMSELENVPAYKRRNVKLSDIPHSSEQPESRYTVSDKDGDDDSGIRPNNSFLHDNVD